MGRKVGGNNRRAATAQAAIIKLLDNSAPVVAERIEALLKSGNPEDFETAMNHLHKLNEYGIPKLARTEISHDGEISHDINITVSKRVFTAGTGDE